MYFEIIGEIDRIETIAIGGRIKDIMRLHNKYGSAKWRKLKGVAKVRLRSGRVCNAEIHWYEAHGVGRKKLKIKKIIGLKLWLRRSKRSYLRFA